jgi:hypothetical protein
MDARVASDTAHLRVGAVYVGRPVSITGDAPHRLLIVNSLIEDLDFDINNNQKQVREWDWDAGTKLRGQKFRGHVDIDENGRYISKHSPFVPLLIAPVAWLFRGTEWVESVSIWLTLAVTVLGIWVFSKIPGVHPKWVLALGFASPLWCYARDFWSEAWLASAWMGLLYVESSLPAIFSIAVLGILAKYSFALVPATMGAVALWDRRIKRAVVLWSATVFALVVAFLTVQYLFRDVNHFSLFHLGICGKIGFGNQARDIVIPTFRPRLIGFLGLLIGPRESLLPFFPFLI